MGAIQVIRRTNGESFATTRFKEPPPKELSRALFAVWRALYPQWQSNSLAFRPGWGWVGGPTGLVVYEEGGNQTWIGEELLTQYWPEEETKP